MFLCNTWRYGMVAIFLFSTLFADYEPKQQTTFIDELYDLSGITVRVLLAQQVYGQSFSFYSSRGFSLYDYENAKDVVTQETQAYFTLDFKSDGVFVEGKKVCSKSIMFRPYNGIIEHEGNIYQGDFYIIKQNGIYFLINCVPLEDYVFSVLKTESWPGWPVEINKVLAITCRSYILHQMVLSTEKDALYHVKNTNHHQTYQGLHNCKIIRQAVTETSGLFLGYEGEPILAMFDCCCGGVIPADISGFVDFVKAPYLARTYPCTYCSSCKSYKWSFSYTFDLLTQGLQVELDAIVYPIKDIHIALKDKAGLVKKVSIKTKKQEYTLTHQQFTHIAKKVRSRFYSIIKRGKHVVIKGKGFGHHMGLCQWGAREMVRRGFSYRKILDFYYPETSLMKVVPKKSQE